ncbi:hypothetical protein IMCC3317_39110 [Kordia antarctica]|uniref:Transport and Golgi organization protein 2 n=1 Tax=Kordia antarctica TaxID=1218801 RepID=A0A7L4ZP51_9FLAO|nr:NRDE family protein [Kordia antarctica]QHI38518.1 hypothetical protein IMCC3317_39110 [Kordia antarctica]
MCTVSFIYKGNEEFVITSNRDESPMRETYKPNFYNTLDTKMIFPKDAVEGGTWIGTSDKKRVVCLLNGGFEMQAHLPKYRHSRGIVVKDFLASTDITKTVTNYNLDLIEPFTIVIVDWNTTVQLFELIWDGTQKHFQKLPLKPRIWSSSTLYTEKMKEMRRNWFTAFQQEETLNATSILNFHKTAGINDPNVDVIMNRGFVQTISITQVEKIAKNVTMNYYDLVKKSHTINSFNPIEAVYE